MHSLAAREAYRDHVLSRNQNIFYKIDWCTIVFGGVSLAMISDIFDLRFDKVFSQVFSQRYVADSVTGRNVRLVYNGILFEIPYSEVIYGINKSIDDLQEYEFVNFVFDKIRMDISGSGLDYLRSEGHDVEYTLRDELADAEVEYHFTRLDFAFDLINYSPEFVKRCYACCKAWESRKGTITIGNGNQKKDPDSIRPVKWSHKDGTEETLYLGSGGGNKMLRIYDKKLQYENKGTYASECPYTVDGSLPESWIRIELQTRKEISMMLMLAENYSPEFIFKYIYNRFAIKMGQGGNAPVCKDWEFLYDWTLIPVILQNAKHVVYISVLDRAEKNIRRNLKSTFVYIAHYGMDAYINLLKEEFQRIQADPVEQRRWQSIMLAILEQTGELPKYVDPQKGMYKLA